MAIGWKFTLLWRSLVCPLFIDLTVTRENCLRVFVKTLLNETSRYRSCSYAAFSCKSIRPRQAIYLEILDVFVVF